MHASVNDAFPTFSQVFEGYVPWMYLDIKGLVTIGIGNLIDPESSALSLPFVDGSGARATPARISAEWHKLKATPALAKQGHKACKAITELRLSDHDIDQLVRRRLTRNEAGLEKVFHEWHEWPADAQLAVLSMAWAMGSGFSAKWPLFTAACAARDWQAAAANCRMKETGNPGLVPRNNANQRLFRNAHEVVVQNLEPSRLYYPDVVHAPLNHVQV
jgi:GH24 family phage-related lysozyme (muramidase)